MTTPPAATAPALMPDSLSIVMTDIGRVSAQAPEWPQPTVMGKAPG